MRRFVGERNGAGARLVRPPSRNSGRRAGIVPPQPRCWAAPDERSRRERDGQGNSGVRSAASSHRAAVCNLAGAGSSLVRPQRCEATEEVSMSSVVVTSCDQGFIVSTDTVAFKQPVGEKKYGRVRGSTHELFQLSDDVLAAGVGEWTSYLPVLNAAARRGKAADELVPDLLDQCAKKAADSRVFVLSRAGGSAWTPPS